MSDIVKKELEQSTALTTKLGGSKKIGAAAKIELAKSSTNESIIKMETLPNRIGIIFDDSASMYGKPMIEAKAAIDSFIQSCNPNNTAIGIYPMNPQMHPNINLTTDYPTLAYMKETIEATGGTPLFEQTYEMVKNEPITRGVIISDGAPNGMDYGWGETDSHYRHKLEGQLYTTCKSKGIVLDTVFIGREDDTSAIEIMKRIAESTGGVFLHFVPGKSNFATNFKYLSPAYRAMLTDGNFKNQIEGK